MLNGVKEDFRDKPPSARFGKKRVTFAFRLGEKPPSLYLPRLPHLLPTTIARGVVVPVTGSYRQGLVTSRLSGQAAFCLDLERSAPRMQDEELVLCFDSASLSLIMYIDLML
jgi:hypothetical protein